MKKKMTETVKSLKNRLSAAKESLDIKRDYIGFLIWQRKHDEINRKYSNIHKPPIELDFDPAEFEDSEEAEVTLEQALSLLADKSEESVEKPEEAERNTAENQTNSQESPEEVGDRERNDESAADTVSAVDVLRNYARALQEADEKEKELEQLKAEENEIRQLEKEIAQLREEIALQQNESRKEGKDEKEKTEK